AAARGASSGWGLGGGTSDGGCERLAYEVEGLAFTEARGDEAGEQLVEADGCGGELGDGVVRLAHRPLPRWCRDGGRTGAWPPRRTGTARRARTRRAGPGSRRRPRLGRSGRSGAG